MILWDCSSYRLRQKVVGSDFFLKQSHEKYSHWFFHDVLCSFPWKVVCTKVLMGPWNLPGHLLLEGVTLDLNAFMIIIQQNSTRPHAMVPCGLFLLQVRGLPVFERLDYSWGVSNWKLNYDRISRNLTRCLTCTYHKQTFNMEVFIHIVHGEFKGELVMTVIVVILKTIQWRGMLKGTQK
jgi:hypothetical protein